MFRFRADSDGGSVDPSSNEPATTPVTRAVQPDRPARGTGDPQPRVADERDARIGDLERTFKATLRDKELTAALAGMPLVPGAAKQLTILLRDDLEVIEADGQFQIQSRSREPVVDFVRARLAEPEFEHFVRPAGGGGSGAFGGQQTPPNHRANPVPLSPDEEVFASWRARQDRLTELGFAPKGLKGRPIG